MIGTLGLASTIRGTPVGFLNDTRLSLASSTGKPCTASFRAVTEADSAVETVGRRPASLYEILRVKRNATATEIKTAYRSLAKVYHPDASEFKQQGDREFIEIHNAYATLYDPAERAMYDLKLGKGSLTVAGNRRGFYTTRRWETDQCW